MPRYWLSFLCLFAASLACALAVTPLARKFAIRVGAVDYPNKRRVNKTPTPRMGGIAIFAGIVAAFVVQYIGTTYFGWPVVLVPSPRLTVNYWMLVLAFVIIFATGMLDDKFTLTPRAKLLGQVLAATVAAMGGLVIGVIANPFAPGEFIELGWQIGRAHV